MFTRIDIHLTGPICGCEEQNLAWGIHADADGKQGLYVRCNLCKFELRVPHEKFCAAFVLVTPYKRQASIEQHNTNEPEGRKRGRFTVFDGEKHAPPGEKKP